MRHFRLKQTITHATVLSALLPTSMALSHQVQIPIGFTGSITVSASASALVAHQVVPSGLAPMDPKSAPSRGGYVYDAFDRVVRTGVTGECVKHGLWTPELATPDCEPWLFAKPAPAAAPKAAEPAPKAEAKPEPKPAPAPKAAEGFPEWIGPDEWRLGIVPRWPENEFEAPDNIGQPRMFFGGEDDGHGEHQADLISEPVMHGDQPQHDGGDHDLVSPPIVYFDEGSGRGDAGDLIGAPKLYGDDNGSGITAFDQGQWPRDPYAAGIPEEPVAAAESNDKWMPAPRGDDRMVTPSAGIMEFKEEGVWPANPYPPGEFIEDRPVTAADDSWVMPNPLAPRQGGEGIASYDEGGKDPEELISNPIMYFDTEDRGVIPPEDIIGHTLVQTEDQGEGAAGPADLIGSPRQYGTDDTGAGAAAPYDGSEFNRSPFPEAAREDAPEGEPFNSQFVAQPSGGGAAPAAAPAPVQITDSGLAFDEQHDDDDDQDNDAYSSSPLMAKGAAADLPYPGNGATAAGPAATDVPAYSADEEDDDDVEDAQYVADYSKVPTAKGALDKLPQASAAKPAAPAAPAPAKEEEHLMTVVLSADALFEFDRYAVRKGGNKSLREFVDALKQMQWGHILVVGHTDRLGSDKYNLRLSERRAQTVRKELIKLGLDGKKIKAIGKGKSEPITKDCVGDKRSKALIECLQPDRRVEIFVDEKQQIIIKKAPGK